MQEESLGRAREGAHTVSRSHGSSVRRSMTSTDSLLGQPLRRLQRRLHHRAVGDDRQVVALPRVRASPIGTCIPVRHLVLDPAVEGLCSKKSTGFVVADRDLISPLASSAVAGPRTLSPGMCDEPRLGVLRVERPAGEAAAGGQRGPRSAPARRRASAAWPRSLTSWSKPHEMKSANCISATGRSPISAAPVAARHDGRLGERACRARATRRTPRGGRRSP